MFNMENLEDLPKHPLLKDNIKYMQNKPKEEIYDALMEEILDSSFAPFQLDDGELNVKTVELEVSVPAAGTTVNVTGKIEGNTLSFPLCVNNKSYVFSTPKEKICSKTGWRVCLPTENGVDQHDGNAVSIRRLKQLCAQFCSVVLCCSQLQRHNQRRRHISHECDIENDDTLFLQSQCFIQVLC